MSLILGTRLQEGILLASDSFAFDNDGSLPQKRLSFDKLYVSSKYDFAVTSVGSRWVFDELMTWAESRSLTEDQLLESLASKWADLNQYWKTKREIEIGETQENTLLPLSDSLFIFAHTRDIERIYIISGEGKQSQTSSFVVSGSGSYLVREFMKESRKAFNPSQSLGDCLSLIRDCYRVASNDLYVAGFPSLVLVTSDRVIDVTTRCAEIWGECEEKYFREMESSLRKAFA